MMQLTIPKGFQSSIEILMKSFRADLVIGVLEKLREDKGLSDIVFLGKEDINFAKQLLSKAINDENLRETFEKNAAKYIDDHLQNFLEIFDSKLAHLILSQFYFANSFSKNMKQKLSTIITKISHVRELVAYFYTPKTLAEVIKIWNVPSEWSDKKIFKDLFIEDNRITEILSKAKQYSLTGTNIVILGEPGVGKTSLLFKLFVDLSKIKNVALIVPGTPIKNIHEDLGITLFIDDLPQQPSQTIQNISKVRNIVATARTHEYKGLLNQYPEIRNTFIELHLGKASQTFLQEMLLRLLSKSRIPYEDTAIKIVVEKAKGTPMYIYQIYKDLTLKLSRERYAKLDRTFAEAIPPGMYEYIGELIQTSIVNRQGGKSMLAALKTIAILKTKTINSSHLAQLYQTLCEKLGEKPNWDLYNQIHTLLIYDPKEMTIKFPHDTWIDTLKGKSNILQSALNLIDNNIPDKEKVKLARISGETVWNKKYSDIIYLKEKEVLTRQDLTQALLLACSLRKEFPEVRLFGLEEIKSLLQNT